ncbi:MAG: HAD family hydrolase [Planctomycetes bacterium]|nr:HAD family hydrolase [Planctomycetota bacterium]
MADDRSVALPEPEALLLDLDGVLADIERRTALVVPAVLAELAARLPIAVVTSCPAWLADSVLNRHGFLPYVRAVVTSEDGPGKPSPAPVLLALERLGKDGAIAWMLGDNPSDVQAARAAGVIALAVAPVGIGAEAHARRLCAAGAVRLVDGGLAGLGALLG